MIKTMFLAEQSDQHNKTFASGNVSELASKVLSPRQRLQVVNEVATKSFGIPQLMVSRGGYRIPYVNEIYNIEYIKGNIDIQLPKPTQILDWVVLWYHQDQTIFNVDSDNKSKIRILGNKERIMGFDEPLECDIAFMSLRLTYTGPINGWVVT